MGGGAEEDDRRVNVEVVERCNESGFFEFSDGIIDFEVGIGVTFEVGFVECVDAVFSFLEVAFFGEVFELFAGGGGSDA